MPIAGRAQPRNRMFTRKSSEQTMAMMTRSRSAGSWAFTSVKEAPGHGAPLRDQQVELAEAVAPGLHQHDEAEQHREVRLHLGVTRSPTARNRMPLHR